MIGELYAILTFTILTFCFGYTVLYLTKAKPQENFLLMLLEMAAIGLATFSFITVILNLLHIPLHFLIYIVLAVPIPIIALTKQFKGISIKWKSEETICFILLLIILGSFFAVFYKGATSYPYFEDDDPWNHVQAADYVGRMHTYSVDPQVRELSSGYAFYLEPYPPTYDALMGVLWQTNNDIVWTLKFFNVLLITLAIGFFYLFAKLYLKSDLKALFATFCIAALPSFMGHFIWSQTLALALFPVGLYAVIKALDDKTWRIPAIVAVASELVTQPVVSFVFGVVVLLLVALVFVHELLQKKPGKVLHRFPQTINTFIVGAGGVALSFVYWGAEILKWTFAGFMKLRGGELTSGWGSAYALQKYDLIHEVIIAPASSRIDQPTGFGIGISICLFIAVLMFFLSAQKTFSLKKGWVHLHTFIWFALLMYAVFAPTFGVPGWGTSRAWAYLAIPLVLIVTEGIFIFINSVKQNIARYVILLIIVIGIGATSIPAKVTMQTSQWPPGIQWTYVQDQYGNPTPIDLLGYVQMQKAIPLNSRVYSFCHDDSRAIGFDMQADPWDMDQAKFRQNQWNATSQDIMLFLFQHNYQYITIDASCSRENGQNATQDLVSKLVSTSRFEPVVQQQGFLLAKVR